MEKYSLSYGTNEYGSCFHCSTWALLGRRIRELNVVIRPMERRELNSNNRKCILSLLHMPSLLRLRLYLNNNEKGNNIFNNRKYIPSFRIHVTTSSSLVCTSQQHEKGTIGRKINSNRKCTPPLLGMSSFCVILCTSTCRHFAFFRLHLTTVRKGTYWKHKLNSNRKRTPPLPRMLPLLRLLFPPPHAASHNGKTYLIETYIILIENTPLWLRMSSLLRLPLASTSVNPLFS